MCFVTTWILLQSVLPPPHPPKLLSLAALVVVGNRESAPLFLPFSFSFFQQALGQLGVEEPEKGHRKINYLTSTDERPSVGMLWLQQVFKIDSCSQVVFVSTLDIPCRSSDHASLKQGKGSILAGYFHPQPNLNLTFCLWIWWHSIIVCTTLHWIHWPETAYLFTKHFHFPLGIQLDCIFQPPYS